MAAPQLRRAVVTLLVLAAVAVALIIAVGGGGTPHTLWVSIPDATGLLSGEPIRDAGVTIGHVSSVDPGAGGHRARIGLSIDPAGWPIQRGAIFRLRTGGTVSYLNDYVDLMRPRHDSGTLPDGATLSSSRLVVPVQFDTLINDFTPAVRTDLRSMLIDGGPAFAAAQPGLRQTLQRTPAAVAQASALLGDLNAQRDQLTSLVSTTGRVVSAFDSASPTVEALVSGAAQTLGAVGARATALRDTLARAPGTFTRIDGTLGTTDRTLDLAGNVTTQIGPGVTQLRETVRPLQHLLSTVTSVAPNAEATLTTAGRSAPRISRLLSQATQLMPTIDSVSRQGLTSLQCIRPYTPDAMSLFTNWGGFISGVDGSDYEARILPSVIPYAPTNVQGETPAQAAQLFPGMTDSFPKPPGWAAGQSWFQPQCGVTPSVLNPALDPETHNTTQQPLPAPAYTGPTP